MDNTKDTLSTLLTELSKENANHFDPARFAYISSLAQRRDRKKTAVFRKLDKIAIDKLKEYQDHFEQAKIVATETVAIISQRHPESKEKAQRLFEECHFKELNLILRKLDFEKGENPLKDITQKLISEQPSSERKERVPLDHILDQQEEYVLEAFSEDSPVEGNGQTPPKTPLITLHLFKDSRSKFHSERLVARSMKERPENAGPLNSQMLVTQSLIKIQQLSPGYLKRFVSYLETLLFLEELSKEKK